MTLPRVSASKLKMYEKCPKMYVYNYLRGQKGPPNIWALIGSAAHKAIETHYKDNQPILKTFAEKTNQMMNPDIEGFEHFTNTYSYIVNGLKEFDPTLYKPKVVFVEGKEKLQLERYFRLPYPNADNAICSIEGYIDMVTEDNLVVDYKTGAEVVSKKGMINDLQFIIYAWAHNVLYGEQVSGVIHHRIRNNKQTKQTVFNYEKLDTTIQTFLADPMVYDLTPCDTCTLWCGVNQYNNRELQRAIS